MNYLSLLAVLCRSGANREWKNPRESKSGAPRSPIHKLYDPEAPSGPTNLKRKWPSQNRSISFLRLNRCLLCECVGLTPLIIPNSSLTVNRPLCAKLINRCFCSIGNSFFQGILPSLCVTNVLSQFVTDLLGSYPKPHPPSLNPPPRPRVRAFFRTLPPRTV